jgi:hypothetical protein
MQFHLFSDPHPPPVSFLTPWLEIRRSACARVDSAFTQYCVRFYLLRAVILQLGCVYFAVENCNSAA